MAGILWQWYYPISLFHILFGFSAFFIAIILISFLPLSLRYQWRVLQGLIIHGILISLGSFIGWMNHPGNDPQWYGHRYREGDYLVVRLSEPLTEKTSTYKTIGIVESIWHKGQTSVVKGKLLLYFFKDPLSASLRYGDRIVIRKPLQAISNSGNPGAFDYRQYAALQQLYHRAYLKQADWQLLGSRSVDRFQLLLLSAREGILAVLRKHLASDPEVLGIAEALLIGYTHDLDRDLVKAYSNTGVVHIIAISGMHLALIYLLLVRLFSWIPGVRRSNWAQLVLILVSLWFFSLLTGASASVLRAAVMFSFISIGKQYNRVSSVYNSLAASAFLLLVYDPAFLWDVGFQLSYLAVAGILMFQRPLYQSVYLKYRWADKLWQLSSVTLAAQVFTFPACLYYFHQFPVLFLLANLLIVPLSGLILYTEMILLILFWIPYAGEWTGWINTWLIRLMNVFIRWVNQLPYAVWDGIPADLLSTGLLYVVVGGFAYWLLVRKKAPLFMALSSLLCFTLVRSYNEWHYRHQRKLVVYQVPKCQAIDIICGHEYRFIGDSSLKAEGLQHDFYLKPARTYFQLHGQTDSLEGLSDQAFFHQFGTTRFAILDHSVSFRLTGEKMPIDYIILSKNPAVDLRELQETFDCSLYLFDASNSLWKIGKWQKEAEALHLRYYSIPEKGAFVFDFAD